MSNKPTTLKAALKLIAQLTREVEILTTKKYAIVDNLLDAVVIIDEDNNITTFNPAAEKMFGYKQNEILGKNVRLLCPEPVASEHDKYIQRYTNTNQKHVIDKSREEMARHKDGSHFPILLSINEMWLDDQRHFIALIKDITKQKEMELMKNEFISTVSHELRTPLTSIRGALGLISGGAAGDISTQHKTLYNIAASNTERLLLLINDILDIEKIDSGKMRFDFKRINLVKVIERCILDNMGIAKEFNVSFELQADDNVVFIYADEDRLIQVVNNLLSNAAKFSDVSEIVDIKLLQHNGLVRMSVIDYGLGIPPEFMSKLFDKFTQADSEDSRAIAGTGLGLSISKSIVEKHQGKIFAESEEGNGAVFHLDLPVVSNTAASDDSEPVDIKYEILIVEDDPDIAELIRRMLSEANCHCDIAYDTVQARNMLEEKPYDAMTLDLILPGQSGIEFLTELSELGTEANMPVVVISVNADNQKISAQKFTSVVEWIQKPIDSHKLISAVTTCQPAGSVGKPLILQVEDEDDVLEIVGMILEDYANIITASTLAEAREKLDQYDFDLVLLDIGLPDGSGLDLLVDLKNNIPPVNTVIFSAHDVKQDIADQVSAALVKSRTSNMKLIQTIKAAIQ